MWSRILRLLTSVLNAYSFYTNPLRFVLTVLTIVVFPYLIYIFWGTIIILALIGLGFYLLYRMIKNVSKNGAYR